MRSSRWINESVASASADFSIGLSTGEESGVERELVLGLPLVSVLPRKHPLASRDIISLRELEGGSLITLSSFVH